MLKLHELHVALFEIDLAVLIIDLASYKGLSIELVFSYYDMLKNQEKVFITLSGEHIDLKYKLGNSEKNKFLVFKTKSIKNDFFVKKLLSYFLKEVSLYNNIYSENRI